MGNSGILLMASWGEKGWDREEYSLISKKQIIICSFYAYKDRIKIADIKLDDSQFHFSNCFLFSGLCHA